LCGRLEMSAALKEISKHFPQVQLSHTTQISRLYRRSLRTTADWFWQRAVQRQKQMAVRAEFEKYRNETNPLYIQKLVDDCEALLSEFAHFQPYVHPEAPGGTKWEV